MRITMITATPRSVDQGSGTFVALETLIQGLAALGHHVDVVAPARRAGWFGYTLHRFRFNHTLRAAALGTADLVVGWDMDGYRFAGKLPCPFVTYVHGQLADEARFERGLVALWMRLQARAERRSAQRADRVLTVSRFARGRLCELYGLPLSRVGVVPPAFDASRWRRALDHAERDPDRARSTVLSVARMYPRKNLEMLVRAADLLRDRIPGLRVRLIGDGPERRRLETLARRMRLAPCVEFAGQISFAALAHAYANCDVFCLPSRQEGFGIVFLEAMAAGKPVIACRGTAAEELIGADAGRLVPPDDAHTLAEELYRLLSDPTERRRLGSRGPSRVEAFAPVPIAQRFLDESSVRSSPATHTR